MSSNAKSTSITKSDVKSAILMALVHLLLPLSVFPLAFFAVPTFVEKSREFSIRIPVLTSLVFQFAAFVRHYWYLYLLMLSFAVMIDIAIYLALFHFKKKISCLWSWGVILCEAVCMTLCVLGLLIPLHHILHAPQLCPI